MRILLDGSTLPDMRVRLGVLTSRELSPLGTLYFTATELIGLRKPVCRLELYQDLNVTSLHVT